MLIEFFFIISEYLQYKPLIAASSTQTTHSGGGHGDNGAVSFSSFQHHLGLGHGHNQANILPTVASLVQPIKIASPILHHQQQPQQLQGPLIQHGYGQSYNPYSRTISTYGSPIAQGSIPVPAVQYGTHLYHPGAGYSSAGYTGPQKFT